VLGFVRLPYDYLSGHGVGPDACSGEHSGSCCGVAEWFADVDEAQGATAATWVGGGVILDPEIRYSLIGIGSDHGEWVEVFSDWRDESGESPSFQAGDDYRATPIYCPPACTTARLEVDVTVACWHDRRTSGRS
jgi:hypothetical protein